MLEKHVNSDFLKVSWWWISLYKNAILELPIVQLGQWTISNIMLQFSFNKNSTHYCS